MTSMWNQMISSCLLQWNTTTEGIQVTSWNSALACGEFWVWIIADSMLLAGRVSNPIFCSNKVSLLTSRIARQHSSMTVELSSNVPGHYAISVKWLEGREKMTAEGRLTHQSKQQNFVPVLIPQLRWVRFSQRFFTYQLPFIVTPQGLPPQENLVLWATMYSTVNKNVHSSQSIPVFSWNNVIIDSNVNPAVII